MTEERISPEDDQKEEQVRYPYNDLELSFMTTEPSWGRQSKMDQMTGRDSVIYQCKGCGSTEMTLKQNLITCKNCGGQDTEAFLGNESLWAQLNYMTRDLRMGNLKGQDYKEAKFYLDFAGDLLRMGMIKSFTLAISRVAARLELSQSRDGFFRKRMNTVTSERVSREDDPKKNRIMGGSRE